MKTIKTVLFAAVLALVGLTSCNKTNDYETRNDAVQFKASIEGETRLSGNAWENGDAIGIFMKKNAQLIGGANTLASNKKHTTNASGTFSNATPADAITFPDGENVDFVAYYPYNSNVTGTDVPVDISTQNPLRNIDLMYSNDAVALSKTNSAVTLGFNHILSKVIIDVTNESGTNLNTMTSVVTGMATRSSFSLATGTLTDESNSANDITAITTATGSTAVVEAVVLPVVSLNGAKVDFITDSKTYTLTIPANTKYEGGKSYTYTIAFKSDGSVALSGSATIADWQNVPSGHHDLNQNVAGNNGSQASPFTVSEVAAQVGQTAKWVTGFVVGTTSNGRAVENFAAPFTTNTNILIAASANETNPANCIVIALDKNAALQARLNLVDHADLLKTQIKIKGDIAASVMGYTGIDNITEEVGGKNPVVVGGGSPVQFFFEDFSDADATARPLISAFTNWRMTSVTYSDSFAKADLRQTTTMPIAIWFPATGNSEFNIAGIDGTYKNVKLSLQMAAQTNATSSGNIQIFCNGTKNAQQMTYTFTATNAFTKIENIEIPDGTTSIRFFSDITLNKTGFRIREIELVGTK